MSFMSSSQFAQHRKVGKSYISALKSKGFLDDALVWKKGKKHPLIDSIKADRVLDKGLDPNYRKGSPVAIKNHKASETKTKADDSFIKARTESERMRAADRKLNYEIKQGKWMPKAQVRAEAFKAGRMFRDAMLNIPNRIDAILAAETDQHMVNRLLTEEIEQVLRELVRQINQMTVDDT